MNWAEIDRKAPRFELHVGRARARRARWSVARRGLHGRTDAVAKSSARSACTYGRST